MVNWIRKLVCKLAGHKWGYNFGWIPNKRKCSRCGAKERMVFNQHSKHPADLEIWIKEGV